MKSHGIAPSPPSKGWTLVLAGLATFMTALDTLVVTTALPVLRTGLHASLLGKIDIPESGGTAGPAHQRSLLGRTGATVRLRYWRASQVAPTRLRIADLAGEAFDNVVARPGRALLTVLGTVLGTAAFVATLG